MNSEERIFVVDDEKDIVLFLERALQKKGYEVYGYTEPNEALAKLRTLKPRLVIADIVFPDTNGIEILRQVKEHDPDINVLFITAHASLETAISAIRGGASDYLVKPFKTELLLSVVRQALSTKRLVASSPAAKKNIFERYTFKNLIGSSPQMQEIYGLIEKVSRTDSTVLVLGDSGTGKELVARSIHFNSKRKDQPFVSVNCGALPDQLLESELFGHERGAFTGAVNTKTGLLELAEGGSFFFDEVAEMSPNLQVKLLRVLQEREIRRVGGLKNIPVNIRVIAATGKDLAKEVGQNRFREDLFYRLNVVPIYLPPLRERREDIPLLIYYFLGQYANKLGTQKKIQVDPSAIEYLQSYSWPGNIRELENLMERILMLCDSDKITREEIERIHDRHLEAPEETKTAVPKEGDLDLKHETEGFEKQLIEDVLRSTNGNKFQAARKLRISRQSLQYKMKKYGFESF